MLDSIEQTANDTYNKINEIVTSKEAILNFIEKEEKRISKYPL